MYYGSLKAYWKRPITLFLSFQRKFNNQQMLNIFFKGFIKVSIKVV